MCIHVIRKSTPCAQFTKPFKLFKYLTSCKRSCDPPCYSILQEQGTRYMYNSILAGGGPTELNSFNPIQVINNCRF